MKSLRTKIVGWGVNSNGWTPSISLRIQRFVGIIVSEIVQPVKSSTVITIYEIIKK